MEMKENDFVTAIVCVFGQGKAIQGQVIRDFDCEFNDQMKIGGILVEDYRPEYGCYFRHLDDGEMYSSVRVLEVADSLQELKIDLSTVDVPTISKAPMNEICGMVPMHIVPEDITFYRSLLTSPAVMYNLYMTHNNDIDKAQEAFVGNVLQEQTQFRDDITDALEDFCDDFGIDGIVDEHGNKIV